MGTGPDMTSASGKRRTESKPEDYSFKYTAPIWTQAQTDHLRRAASLHAQANPSDPFAYGRMLCHLRRGIETPGGGVPETKTNS
jgi:hypothetical protein